jgi:transposase
MKIENIDVNESLKNARELLENEKNVSYSFKAIMEVLFLIITLLMNRLNLNSKNSSKPPSYDPNRKKKQK